VFGASSEKSDEEAPCLELDFEDEQLDES